MVRGLVPLWVAAQAVAAAAAQAPPPSAARTVVLEADLARARALGWLDARTSDDAALDAAAATLQRRLAGVAPGARVARADGARVAVMLPPAAAGAPWRATLLTRPCRLACRVVAEDDDVAALGARLEGEERRLHRWRGAHPRAALTAFDPVRREDGGPHPALVWRAPAEADAEPMPLLRAAVQPLAVAAGGARPAEASAARGVTLPLDEPSARALRAFGERFSGRTLALVLDDEMLCTAKAPAPDDAVALEPGASRDEPRALAAALAGGALDVPLTEVDARAQSEVRRAQRGS